MEEVLHLKITRITWETADAATYELENTAGFLVPYQAGQFLTLLMERGGKELRRSYSLSSTFGVDVRLSITIKRVPNGEVSRYLLDTLREGDVLRSLYPAGRFVLTTNAGNQRDIFLIGAGSGITPLFSILKWVLHREPRSRVVLLDSNRSRETVIYWDALQSLARQFPDQLKVIHLFSDPSPAWSAYRGRLENTSLEQLVSANRFNDPGQALFLVCGPPAFIRMVRITLIFMGYDKAQIRKENFVTEPLLHAVASPPLDSTPKQVGIWFRNQLHQFDMRSNQTLLEAGLDHQLPLPYSCRGGACATCVARCTAGKVRMTVNDVLTDREVAEGYVLTCVAYPETDGVRIEFDSLSEKRA